MQHWRDQVTVGHILRFQYTTYFRIRLVVNVEVT